MTAFLQDSDRVREAADRGCRPSEPIRRDRKLAQRNSPICVEAERHEEDIRHMGLDPIEAYPNRRHKSIVVAPMGKRQVEVEARSPAGTDLVAVAAENTG